MKMRTAQTFRSQLRKTPGGYTNALTALMNAVGCVLFLSFSRTLIYICVCPVFFFFVQEFSLSLSQYREKMTAIFSRVWEIYHPIDIEGGRATLILRQVYTHHLFYFTSWPGHKMHHIACWSHPSLPRFFCQFICWLNPKEKPILIDDSLHCKSRRGLDTWTLNVDRSHKMLILLQFNLARIHRL